MRGSRRENAMKVTIEKSRACGSVCAPPSKSMAHRLLICAGLCDGESTVKGIAKSEDILATLDCLKALGASFSLTDDSVRIRGADPKNRNASAVFACRESGSTLRFFLPVALLSSQEAIFTGSDYLLSRPLQVYETICNERHLPFSHSKSEIRVRGPLPAGRYKVPGNVSSQFISGLLFALALQDKDSVIELIPPVESGAYIDLTVAALAQFGVSVMRPDNHTLATRGGQRYQPRETTVEGDYSNAAFLSVFNLLGGDVSVRGLRADSLQGDRVYADLFAQIASGTPTIHIADCPDLGPILFALAAAKQGAVFTGTRRLKLKESDRAEAMRLELAKFGVDVRVDEDRVTVLPKDFHAPDQPLSGHNDHRIVMALSVLLTQTGGTIDGAEAVAKSFPDFFETLAALQIRLQAN